MKHPLFVFRFFLALSLLTLTGLVNAQDKNTYRLGDMRVEMLIDDVGEGDVSILQNVSEELFKKYTPSGKYKMAVTSALIRESGRTLLIDAGLGKKIRQHLKARKIEPAKVDAILLTHMHFDHIRGLMHMGKAYFPKAKLYISEREVAYWSDNANINAFPEDQREMITSFFKESQQVLAAYKDRIEIFAPGELAENGKELIPGVKSIAAYGHTPGHTLFMLEKQDKKLLVSGDIWHVGAIQFAHPEVTIIYDIDQTEAAKARRAVFEYVSANQVPMTGMHQSKPEFGFLKAHAEEKNGYTFVPVK